jgi:sulfite reductase (NADPH) hemoprotein beta-component
LYELWQLASATGLATANAGLLTDIIACPGGDYCSLANARSLPIAKSIAERFDNLDFVHDLGELSLNISGCINACGHHHMGNIGILGVDKDGQEWYQVTIGGMQGKNSALGKVIGPSFKGEEMPEVIDRIVHTYLALRVEDEQFMATVERTGLEPFKRSVYADTLTANG